jgi:hypothetical protein
MTKYEFEIQELIKVIVEADTREDARSEVIYKLEKGDYDFQDPYVSDGKEVK